MASLKKIGFFWGEDKITIVEFDKNVPLQVVSASLGSKSGSSSPFSSSLTEEIQTTAVLQKMLQDNHISGGSFHVSLPMKEIILRSFIIPFVKQEEIQNVIKFEAKKYIPFDIQDLSFVFYAIPFLEDGNKRLQVIFFAARKEVLARYDRVLKLVNSKVSYCEPYMVSLSKALLFKKEIKPTDHLAFLILDKNLGRICFIDKGIPQFIREFPISSSSESEEVVDSVEDVNLKIVNEVGNSFDFYTRQFSGDRIDQMLLSSDAAQSDLLRALETELKVTIRQFSPVVTVGADAQNDTMDAIYALGACVSAPMESLSGFNFLGDQKKSSDSGAQNALAGVSDSMKDVLYVFLICAALLAGVFVFFQAQLKVAQQQYDQLTRQEGNFKNVPVDSIQAETGGNISRLAGYKGIRRKSDVVSVILKVASHLPQGVLLANLNITYNQDSQEALSMTIDMKGEALQGDPNEQIAIVYRIFSDFKSDKELAGYVKQLNLVSINREEFNGRPSTGFVIHCS